MKRTPLKRKTPLKAYKPLKAKKPLKSNCRLKTRQKTARKLSTPYYSIFTVNMGICHITGDTRNVEPHHIFQGKAYKELSEKYGFIVPSARLAQEYPLFHTYGPEIECGIQDALSGLLHKRPGQDKGRVAG